MMMEESAEKLVKYEVSGGIPPSITLQLAASKGPLKSSTSSPMASTGIQHNLMQNSLQKMEMKSTGGDRKERVKATLQELLECNHDMMQTVQKQLAQQTNLLRTLMELL